MKTDLFDDLSIAASVLDSDRWNNTNFLLDCWDTYEPYADADFRTELNRAITDLSAHQTPSPDRTRACDLLQQRYWEMLTGMALLSAGFQLIEYANRTSAGPDHLVDLDGRRLWIECTAPGPGTTADRVPETKISTTPTVSEVPNDQITLRLSGAIKTKQAIYKDQYLTDGIADEDDLFIIAVNGRNTSVLPADDSPPRILKYLYRLGPIAASFDLDTNKFSDPYLTLRNEIPRITGDPIPTGAFANGNLPHVSGVIYSHCDPWNRGPSFQRSIVLVPNGTASNPLSRNFCLPFHCWHVENKGKESIVRLSNPGEF
jgi:hypothetical protein